MCRQPGKERLGSRIAKPVFARAPLRKGNQPIRGAPAARDAEGTIEPDAGFPAPVPSNASRTDPQPAPLLTVFAEHSFGLAEIALQRHGRSVVERMRQGRRRVDPLQSVVRARAAKRRTASRRPWDAPPIRSHAGNPAESAEGSALRRPAVAPPRRPQPATRLGPERWPPPDHWDLHQ